MIITDASFSESGLTYAVQLAIGFGSSTIAIRKRKIIKKHKSM
nr:MAG TPA: hypothetical protein [Caudoviricetes sp.]